MDIGPGCGWWLLILWCCCGGDCDKVWLSLDDDSPPLKTVEANDTES